MLPAIPDGVVACAAAIWAMTAAVGVLRIARSCRALGRLKRASSPFDRSREARLPLWVAARDRRPPGSRTSNLRLHDWSVRARTRPARHPRVARCGRRAQRRIAGRDRDARAGASRSLRRLVAAAAGRRRQPRGTAPGRAIPRATAGCRPRGRVRRSRRVVHRGSAPLRLLSACSGCGVESGGGWSEFAAGVPTATTTASALRVRVGRLLDPRRDRGARLAGATSLVERDGSGARRRHVDAGGSRRDLPRDGRRRRPGRRRAPAIDVRRAIEPAPRTNVNAAARMPAAAATPHVARVRSVPHSPTRRKRQLTRSPARRWTHPDGHHSTAGSLRRTPSLPVLAMPLPSIAMPAASRRRPLEPRPLGSRQRPPRRLPPAMSRAPLRRPAPAPGVPASQSAVS